MTRFLAPDLSRLPPPPAVEVLDREQAIAARKADLAARLTSAGHAETADLLVLETEPLTISLQTEAAFEITQRARINDAVRSVMAATAKGTDLDHVVLTNYGVARLVLVEADPTATPPVEEVLEDDETYLARALLSMEARSAAGPEGAYMYFALQASGDVLDVRCYGEEDGALYANGDPVIAPEVLIVVLSRFGNGEPEPELLELVLTSLGHMEERPIGDKVVVEPAVVTTYSVEAVLRHRPGPSEPLLLAAQKRLEAYAEARRMIGNVVQRIGIGAALKVTDVEEISIVIKDADGDVITADEIDPGSKGSAYCTSISLVPELVEDSWR